VICSLAASLTLTVQAQQPQTVAQGVYTDAQAGRGQAVYSTRCTTCHGATLAGRTGPALAGDDFNGIWSRQPVSELVQKIFNTMPKDDTGKLSLQQSTDIVAYMLQVGKFPAGRTDLLADDAALKQITFPAAAASSPKPAPANAALLPPVGNLAQVMRGILFPSSNIVFTVQSVDPGAKKETGNGDLSTAGGFDWLTWGGSVYKGWDLVDYAAVPVDDPDWKKFTAELAEAGRAAYKASQTRDQAKVSDSTNQLNDSCSHCHGAYRGRTHCVK
jgi:mono/diheme cytochrome c family protein